MPLSPSKNNLSDFVQSRISSPKEGKNHCVCGLDPTNNLFHSRVVLEYLNALVQA